MNSKISSGFFPRSSTFKLILASSSPRRIELLGLIGFHPPRLQIVAPKIDESPLHGESPRKMVARLAAQKAKVIADSSKGDRLIISADTTVVLGKRILGKPHSQAEARRMLSAVQGKTHVVLTGYCLLARRGSNKNQESLSLTRVVRTQVRMRRLSRSEIACYVRTGEPLDKAGAYAAQGLGSSFIESIQGSYTNVVGLPLSQLSADLEETFGVHSPILTR